MTKLKDLNFEAKESLIQEIQNLEDINSDQKHQIE